MPKGKSNSAAKKRFKLTGTGKVLRRKAPQSHNLEKKSPKRKRAFTRAQSLHESNVRAVKKLLGGQ